jgi:phosphopantetheinyl transferase
LHPDEFSYLATSEFEKRQHSYLLGRYSAKQTIVRFVNHTLPFSNVLVRSGVFEQPVMCCLADEKIQVSLSHSGHLGLALVFPETHPMGVDLEVLNSEQNTIIESQLTSQEKKWIKNCLYAVPSEILYGLFWTVKEALSKVLRTGMTAPFSIYALTNITFQDYYWLSEFENFAQYQAISFILVNNLCSIVYPKQVKLIINIPDIQDWMLTCLKKVLGNEKYKGFY